MNDSLMFYTDMFGLGKLMMMLYYYYLWRWCWFVWVYYGV